jgi:hypothetical protein
MLPSVQGSNIFDGFSKIDQGRSLLACTTRMFEILSMRQTEVCLTRICPNHISTSMRLNPHPRGIRLFTFQRTRRFPVETSRTTFVVFVVCSPIGEANLIVVFFTVNGVLRIFSGFSKFPLIRSINRHGQSLSAHGQSKLWSDPQPPRMTASFETAQSVRSSRL